MNAYIRKDEKSKHSARIDIPSLITARCWKNGKRVKCPPKSRVKSKPLVKKTRKNKSTCWKDGKKVKCSTLVPPMLRWLIKAE